MQPNLYIILGVHPNATQEEIKKAYHKLAKEHHPDKGGDATAMGVISAAYEILSDPEKRKRYDQGETVEAINRPQDGFEREVLQSLVHLFLVTINSTDPDRLNIFDRMKSTIIGTESQIKAELNGENNKISKYEKVKSRISTTSQDNLFVSVLNQQISESNKIKDRLNHQLKVGQAMIKFLEDYKYNLEEAMLQISNDNYFTVSGFTFTSHT